MRMQHFLKAFLCMATSVFRWQSSATGDTAFVPVFVAGDSGYSCYRIPAMVTTLKGTILAVADGRISDCHDIPNPIDLVLKRSLDRGRSWTPLQVIADYGRNTNDTDIYPAYGTTNLLPRVAAGDAALLLDRINGRVWVLYDNGAFVANNSEHRAIKLELRYSDDDGLTWSARIDVEAENPRLRPACPELLAGPGNGIQLAQGRKAGRLIFPVYAYGNPYYSTLIFSDDHGRTWKLGGKAGVGGGEIQIAEAGQGRLIATIRNQSFARKGVRFFNTSNDGGETWGTPYFQTPQQAPVPDPKCQGSVLRIGAKPGGRGESSLVLANPSDPAIRKAMTLRVSADEGRTWPVSEVVFAESSAYSSLTEVAPGQLGLLLETDNYHQIIFTSREVGRVGRPSEGAAKAVVPK